MTEESKQFWGNIWSRSVDYKKDAKWLQDLQSEVNVKKQEKIDIITGSLKKILDRMPNWKSPGPDLVQGFWLKNFSSLHERVRLQLKECVDSGFVPSDHLLFMDDLKLYIQSEKGLDLLVQTVVFLVKV